MKFFQKIFRSIYTLFTSDKIKTGEKVLFGIFGIFVVSAILMYIVLEVYRLNSDKPLFTSRTHYNLSARGKEGSRIYRINRCNSCHRVMRSGTSMGLSLDGVGTKRTYEWILNFLKNPEETFNNTTLDHGPKKEADYTSRLPEDDLVAIATFLSEIKTDRGSSVAPQPPKGDSPFIDNMVRIFAPEGWNEKYTDIREKDKVAEKEPAVAP